MRRPFEKVVCIRALADDLKFLKPVTNRMAKLLKSNFTLHELGDQHSHASALMTIKKGSYDFAVFFTHGGSDYLRGGEYQSRVSREVIETDKFLSSEDLVFFKEKLIFCMSCDSNGLAHKALSSGAIGFVGFDKIPFNLFDDEGNSIGSHVLIKHCQQILANSVQAALECFLTGQKSLDESVEFLRLKIINRAIHYVRSSKSVKERREISALLLETQSGLRYYGQKGLYYGLTRTR